MNNVKNNLHDLLKKIENIIKLYNRKTHEISLVIVTKNQTINTIENILTLKQKNFGENYIQESIKKIQYFQKTMKNNKLIWHYIGSVQSNKTRYVSEYFDWCHTLNNQNIAYRLNKQRPSILPPLNVLIQININNERSKSGIPSTELMNLAENIKLYPRLNLRGVMCIPKHEKKFHDQLKIFNKMYQLFHLLQQNIKNIDTLSIGMSDDMEAAIAAGSTLIRIGKAIFNKNDVSL